ncbi:ATP-binding protein [Effusibacillus consociatus]|uniref:ATP-binding protein n=1 Tax=Effusibacillus consociatus TaxID=1117041 RepID=A0ABV9Q022_9BACL
MILVLIIAWVVAFVLILTDSKTDYIRYTAYCLFTGGCAAISRIIMDIALPFLETNHLVDSTVRDYIYTIRLVFSFTAETGLPYTFLMFSICYSGFFREKIKKILGFLLLLPPISMLFLIYPEQFFSWNILYVWVCPYYLCSFYLLIASLIKEKNESIKRSRMLTLLFTFPEAYLFLAHYTLSVLQIYEAYRFMEITIPIWFVVVVVLAIKYDFLGVKIKLEKKRLDTAIKAITSGTAIYNHSLKNEIGKINILADRLKYNIQETKDQNLIRDIDVIHESTNHLLKMIDRVQHHMKEIIVEKTPHKLSQIIDNTLFSMKPYIEGKGISVDIIKKFDPLLLCDKVHLQETVSNILMNALEAVRNNGHLEILLYDTPKQVVVSIRDNGPGIKKENIPYLFDPFFSTKNGSTPKLVLDSTYQIARGYIRPEALGRNAPGSE